MHPQMLPPGWSSFDSRAVEAFAGRDPNVVDNVPRRNALRYAGLPSSQQRTTNPYTTSRFEVGSSVPVNHTAPPARRLYLDTRVDVDARAPLGGVGQRVDRPVRRRRSAPALWPWLKQRSYAPAPTTRSWSGSCCCSDVAPATFGQASGWCAPGTPPPSRHSAAPANSSPQSAKP